MRNIDLISPSSPASRHIHTHRRKIHSHHQTVPQTLPTRSSTPTMPQTAAKPHPAITRNFFLSHDAHIFGKVFNMGGLAHTYPPLEEISNALRDLIDLQA